MKENYKRESIKCTFNFRPVLPLMYAIQYMPSLSKTIMSALGAGYFAKIRDSRNAIEEKKSQ